MSCSSPALIFCVATSLARITYSLWGSYISMNCGIVQRRWSRRLRGWVGGLRMRDASGEATSPPIAPNAFESYTRTSFDLSPIQRALKPASEKSASNGRRAPRSRGQWKWMTWVSYHALSVLRGSST